MVQAWDWKELSRHFLRQAAQAQNRLWQLEDSAEVDPALQEEYDRVLAAFSAYHHLWGRPFLRSPEELVQELVALLNRPAAQGQARDPERFRSEWQTLIRTLIEHCQQGTLL
jgi:hypothetical protein